MLRKFGNNDTGRRKGEAFDKLADVYLTHLAPGKKKAEKIENQSQIQPGMGKSYIMNDAVELKLTPLHQSICLSSADCEMPVILSLRSKEGSLTSVDLICVLDVSFSMENEHRLELMKEGMQLLINSMEEDHRLGIIVYGDIAEKYLDLELMSGNNKEIAKK